MLLIPAGTSSPPTPARGALAELSARLGGAGDRDYDRTVRGYVAATDYDWYRFLQARPELREVNFWRPSGSPFRALTSGELFFFKLKAPHNAVGAWHQLRAATARSEPSQCTLAGDGLDNPDRCGLETGAS